MALIAIAADKGSPGVTTASVALAAVWPRPVLLAECDPAGGDLVYRLPDAGGGRLDPRRGLLNLAVAARRGLAPHQVWEHSQKLHGGLDILAGVSGAEQGAGLELLWGSVGRLLADVPQADVIADCGRLGADGPIYDLLAHAASVVLLTRATVGEVVRLRDRATAVTAALAKRGWTGARVKVVVIADYRHIGAATDEVGQALRSGSGTPARVLGGLAHEPKSAEQLSGQWGGKLDRSMFIRTARSIAAGLAADLPTQAPAPGAGQPAGQPPGQAPAPGVVPGLTPASGDMPAHGPAPTPGPPAGPHPGPPPGPHPGPAPGSFPDPQHAPPGWGQSSADPSWLPQAPPTRPVPQRGRHAGGHPDQPSPGQLSAGQHPHRQSPAGQSPVGQSPAGQSPVGQSPAGQSPAAQPPEAAAPVPAAPLPPQPAPETAPGQQGRR
jgi:hypothetical protein